MKISFGNTFRLTSYGPDGIALRDKISTQAALEGAIVKTEVCDRRKQKPHFSLLYGKTNLPDMVVVDTIVIKNNKKLDDKTRKLSDSYMLESVEIPEKVLNEPMLITSRMNYPQDAKYNDPILEYSIVNVDAENLEKIAAKKRFQSQTANYFSTKKKALKESSRQETDFIIGCGKPITCPILSVRDTGSYSSVRFEKFNDEHNDELFFALKERGIKQIPVLVDDETRKALFGFGIINN